MTDYIKFFAEQNQEKTNFAVLKICLTTEDQEFHELYKSHIEKHNKIMNTDPFPNSGFDLFVPESTVFSRPLETKMIDLKVKAEMLYCNVKYWNEESHSAYYIFPRSSISKTPLMLSNHTGVIDAGYRGNLMGAFRSFKPEYTVDKETRLVQICHPSLCKIYVVLVNEAELSTTTRGEGGFGSTGLVGVSR